jgi:hypothetical protein
MVSIFATARQIAFEMPSDMKAGTAQCYRVRKRIKEM